MAQMNALSSQKFALKEHRRWLNSDEAEGKRAVFGPLDLKGIQIGRRSLERVVFVTARLMTRPSSKLIYLEPNLTHACSGTLHSPA